MLLRTKKDLLLFCVDHDIAGCSSSDTKEALRARVSKYFDKQSKLFASKQCKGRKSETSWGKDELVALCDSLGLKCAKSASKSVLCAELSAFFSDKEDGVAGGVPPEKLTVRELRDLCRQKKVSNYSGLRKAELVKHCWLDRKKSIEEERVSRALSLGEKDVLKGSLKEKVAGVTSGLAGLLWLLRKYRDKACVASKPSNLRDLTFGSAFCNFSVCWLPQEDYIQYTTVQDADAFWDIVLNWCETRFVIVPVYIRAENKGTMYRHYNFMVIDREKRTAERFEPYGGEDGGVVDKIFKGSTLDKRLSASAAKVGYKYIASSSFCPRVGFQVLEEAEKGEKRAGDPEGFCMYWSVWYADRRLRYPNLSPKELVDKLLKTLTSGPRSGPRSAGPNRSLKNFIRDFANFISTEERRIAQRARRYENTKNWSESRALTESILWEVLNSRKLE